MTNPTHPNDPAFLTIETYPSGSKTISNGLTKREYFAAMAMQGLLANSEQWRFMGANKCDFHREIRGLSVEMTDALIAELNK